MIEKVLNFFGNPFADIIGGWQGRKNMAAQRVTDQQKADNKLRDAAHEALTKRMQTADDADTALDILAQQNRKETYIDELLIVYWLTIITLHFVPYMQPFMQGGWDAIGKAPGWFQIGIVIIVVTTMGGMRILRLFLENANVKKVLGFGGIK